MKEDVFVLNFVLATVLCGRWPLVATTLARARRFGPGKACARRELPLAWDSPPAAVRVRYSVLPNERPNTTGLH